VVDERSIIATATRRREDLAGGAEGRVGETIGEAGS
jgi:hypothetical protein